MSEPINSQPKLIPQGLSTGPDVSGTESAAPVSPLEISNAKTLSELSEEYGFYTPALLHLTVPLTYDPYELFCQENNLDLRRFSINFEAPLFKRLIHPTGDTSWNNVLFAVAKEHYEKLMSWYGTCVFVNNEATGKSLRRVRLQNINIADPLAKANKLPNKLLPITALVIETTKGNFYFHVDPIAMQLPSVVFDTEVHDDVLSFEKAVNDGMSDPYSLRQQNT